MASIKSMTPAEIEAAQAMIQGQLDQMEAERQAKRAATISHVRQPLPRVRTGNQFYKDPGLKGRFGPQPGTTLCGAEPTTEDIDLRWAMSLARKGQLDQGVRCPDCQQRVREGVAR